MAQTGCVKDRCKDSELLSKSVLERLAKVRILVYVYFLT